MRIDAAAVRDDEWMARFKSVWPLRLKEPLTDESVLHKLQMEYPEDPELAAWDRYLSALRQTGELTDAIAYRSIPDR